MFGITLIYINAFILLHISRIPDYSISSWTPLEVVENQEELLIKFHSTS